MRLGDADDHVVFVRQYKHGAGHDDAGAAGLAMLLALDALERRG